MVTTLAATLVAAAAALWFGQRRMIYFPFGGVPLPADVGLATAQAVSFDTADGLTLNAWFVPPLGRSTGVTVIVFNGNAGNRAMRAPLAASLATRGIATLLTDYRGYGGNGGSPSEDGLARDARAARAYLTTRRDVETARIIYFGESLGTAVALNLAIESPPAALILRSPFPSLVAVGRHHYPFLPVSLLLRDRFECMTRAARLACPLLVIAGDRDGIIPIDMSEELFAAAPGPKTFVRIAGADHNDDALLTGGEMVEAIMTFLDR